jgi:hypothetical protein
MPTYEQWMEGVRRAAAAGDLETARRLGARAKAARLEETPAEEVLTPAPKPPPDLPRFGVPVERPSEADKIEADRKEIDKRVDQLVAKRGRLLKEGEADKIRAEVLTDFAQERAQVAVAGSDDKVSSDSSVSGLPIFRPSRIERLAGAQESVPVVNDKGEVVVDPMRGEPIYRTEEVTTPVVQMGRSGYEVSEKPIDRVEVLYRDPKTGNLRKPTPKEELTESFARQQVMSVDEAKAIEDAIRRGERDAPEISGVLSERAGDGKGMIETSLGAALRSVPAVFETAVAEAYFRGLGYEVDEKGQPVDKSDFGYKVAEVRKSVFDELGMTDKPTVRATGPVVETALNVIGEGARAAGKLGTALTGDARPAALGVALDTSARQLQGAPLPLPGVATRREEGRYEGSEIFDPKSRRPAAPAGTDAATTLARAITRGRTLADELQSAPELVKAYDELYGAGSEYVRFAQGTLLSMLVPMGPGTALRTGGAAFSAAKGTQTAAKAAKAVQAGLAPIVSGAKAVEGAIAGSKAPAVVKGPFLAAATKARQGADIAKSAAALASPDEVLNARILEVAAEKMFPGVKFSSDARKLGDPSAYAAEAALAGRLDVERLLPAAYALRRAVPDDAVAVSARWAVRRDDVAKVRRMADKELKDALTDPVTKQHLASLTPDGRLKFVQELRETIVGDIVQTLPKKTDLRRASDIQVYFNDLKPALSDTVMARRARQLFTDAPAPRRAIVAQAERQLTAASQEAIRAVKADFVKLAGEGRSVDEVFNTVIRQEFQPEKAKELWMKVIEESYGGEAIAKDVAGRLADAGVDFTQLPTMAAIRAIDNVPSVIERVPGFGRPDFDRNMLKIIFEEGVRKRVAREARDAFVRAYGVNEKPGDLYGILNLVGAVRANESMAVKVGDQTFNFLSTESKFGEGAEDFFKLVDSVPTARRGDGWATLARDALAWGKAAKRGAKYGYVVPNLPFLMGRAAAAPIISLAQIGATRTLGASSRLPSIIMGRGVTTPSGAHFTAEQIERLARQYGIGTTAVDQERMGRLAQDILDDAAKASTAGPVEKAALYADPAVMGWAQRTADQSERLYRKAVFADGLARGLPADQAAEIARRSLWDYSGTPPVIREQLGRVFATAAESYNATATFLDLVSRDSGAITPALKAWRAKQQATDPYGYYGDKGLKSLGIYRAGSPGKEVSVLGPSAPIFEPVEEALGLLHGASSTYQAVQEGDLIEAARQAGRGTADAVAPQIGAMLDLLRQRQVYESQQSETGKVSDELAFWQALVVADLADPDRANGKWDTVVSIIDPQVVMPPKAYASPTDPSLWIAAPPEGTPYLYLGDDQDGNAIFQVYRPSPRGKANLKAIRNLTPDLVEQAYGVYGAIQIAPSVNAESIMPHGPEGVAAVYLGEPVGLADETAKAAKRAKKVLE